MGLAAKLATKSGDGKASVVFAALKSFVQHGACYCFPATHGGPTRGIAFYPLYPSVPEAAARNPALGELLDLFDALRGGSAREQAIALAMLEERLQR